MELISEAKAEVIEVIEDVGDDRNTKSSVKGDDTLKANKSGESSPASAVVANGVADMSEPINIVDGESRFAYSGRIAPLLILSLPPNYHPRPISPIPISSPPPVFW